MTELDKVFERQNKLKKSKIIKKVITITLISSIIVGLISYKLILSGVIQL